MLDKRREDLVTHNGRAGAHESEGRACALPAHVLIHTRSIITVLLLSAQRSEMYQKSRRSLYRTSGI